MASSYPMNSNPLSGPNWRDELRRLVDGEPEIQATMSAGSALEVKLRAVCIEKGIPFSPQLQAVCDQAAKAEVQPAPSLSNQFAPYGGMDAFLAKYSPLPADQSAGQ